MHFELTLLHASVCNCGPRPLQIFTQSSHPSNFVHFQLLCRPAGGSDSQWSLVGIASIHIFDISLVSSAPDFLPGVADHGCMRVCGAAGGVL